MPRDLGLDDVVCQYPEAAQELAALQRERDDWERLCKTGSNLGPTVADLQRELEEAKEQLTKSVHQTLIAERDLAAAKAELKEARDVIDAQYRDLAATQAELQVEKVFTTSYHAHREQLMADLAAARAKLEKRTALLAESRRTHEMWKDVAPAVSLCSDIDRALAEDKP